MCVKRFWTSTNRIWSGTVITEIKFPQIVMIFGYVSSEGDVILNHIFEQVLRLNSDGYVKLLEMMTAKCWQERELRLEGQMCGSRVQVPALPLERRQKYLSGNFYNFTSSHFWPPNSFDVTPWTTACVLRSSFLWIKVPRPAKQPSGFSFLSKRAFHINIYIPLFTALCVLQETLFQKRII